MNIVHTESSWGWGGQELRILTEAVAMQRRGHIVTIIAPAHAPIFQRAASFGITAVALPIEKKRLPGLVSLRRYLIDHPCDIVNTHSSTDTWLASIACLSMRRPPQIIRTRHVSTPVHDGWTNRWLYGRAAARLVTTGTAVRQQFIDSLGLPPEHVISIPTGVDGERFSPCTAQRKEALRRELGVPTDRYVLGIVATLRKLKGHIFLFQAMKLLNDPSLHLVVVGDGPQMENLKEAVVALGIAAQVSFPGEQPNPQDWLRCFDQFVFPSLAEGVPQALMQAMLTALPCATTDAGAIGELAKHEQTALVCKPGDAAALSHNIRRLRADPPLAASLGERARAHCLQNHSVEHMADAMEAVFMDALSVNPTALADKRKSS